MSTEIDRIERRLERERSARKHSEQLLESKSSELFQASEELAEQMSRVERRNAEIELLHGIVVTGQNMECMNEALQHFIDSVCEMTDWPVGHVCVAGDDPDQLEPVGIWHLSGDFDHFRDVTERMAFRRGESPIGQVCDTREPLWIVDVCEDPGFQRAEECPELAIHAGLFVPIVVNGNVVAVAEFYTREPAERNERYLEAVQLAGSQLGSVLERFETEAELKRSYEELKEAQAQLVQTEKLASIGQLAAGIAHEINNPMGFVSSNLNSLREYHRDMTQALGAYRLLLEHSLDSSDTELSKLAEQTQQKLDALNIEFAITDATELIDETIYGGKRVLKIVSDLRDFSHADSDSISVEDINVLVEKTLTVARNELKYVAEVKCDFGNLPSIPCYGGKLGQLILNLLVNAAHAIEEKGTIWIRTGFGEEMVWVEVEDDGCGIAAENLAKIFDPFFTTKEVGKGTGLGLNLAYKIMEAHNGKITVDSTVGQGTTFRLEFPKVGPPPENEVESLEGR